jgi:hypothetical protein
VKKGTKNARCTAVFSTGDGKMSEKDNYRKYNSKLKRLCPVCTSMTKVKSNGNIWWIACVKGEEGHIPQGFYRTAKEAIQAWNDNTYPKF